ncbi:MAG: Histidine phosphatase superfamily protein [Candidatus Tokpelaia hoelldobleri]|uniref:Histidine phosphatase superfamily protein n=1 Tax=Candidatus Tokpelaia hoelldobleri TaxID=1902579 RepID=A0A1U9JWR4_9HYPH|nr:MAG: Histidine phosphatase superfamily protein [Candidatus Tokpelaia hoelldoblerii]
MARPRIYFSRHGQTDWNKIHRIQGQVERDITEQGRREAARNGRKLKELIGRAEGFDFVASPMRRTRQTMECIRTAMGLDPQAYRTDRQLMELHFGDWQGLVQAELADKAPDLVAARLADKWNFVPPGEKAESYAMLSQRVCRWVEAVRRPTVCVTHGGCLRTILQRYSGLSEHEASSISISQDRILRFDDNGLVWL